MKGPSLFPDRETRLVTVKIEHDLAGGGFEERLWRIHLTEQPRARIGPIAFGGGFRNTQHPCRLFVCQSSEEPKFHQLSFTGVVRGELLRSEERRVGKEC